MLLKKKERKRERVKKNRFLSTSLDGVWLVYRNDGRAGTQNASLSFFGDIKEPNDTKLLWQTADSADQAAGLWRENSEFIYLKACVLSALIFIHSGIQASSAPVGEDWLQLSIDWHCLVSPFGIFLFELWNYVWHVLWVFIQHQIPAN